MATPSDVAGFRSALAAVSQLSTEQLADFLASVDLHSGLAARDALLEIVPALTTQGGEVAALVAAEYYDELRAAEGIPGGYRATLADPTPIEQVEARVRFGASHLFTDTPELIVPFLYGIVDQYVKQPGRDTLVQSAAQDPRRPRWARVPSGRETCDWCVMLASRGFIYLSEDTARRSELTKFHPSCDCALVVDWSNDPRLEGYDPGYYYGLYRAGPLAWQL